MAGLLPQHQAAAEVGGFWLFAVFLVVNAAAIAGCVYLVARYGRGDHQSETRTKTV